MIPFFQKLGMVYHVGDLEAPDFVAKLVKEEKINGVIHCAALTSPIGPWEKFYRANVLATTHLVEMAKKVSFQRFIHISTPSIYFNGKARIDVREDMPLPLPYTPYAKSKLMAEEVVDGLQAAGVPTLTLRPRAIIGPTDQVLMPRILRLMAKGIFPLFHGGTAMTDLTYVDNVVHAIALCLQAGPEAWYKKFNITNGQPRTVMSLCTEIEQELGWKIHYLPLPLTPVLSLAKAMEKIALCLGQEKEPALSAYGIGLLGLDHTLSIALARHDLGYEPPVDLSRGLKEALAPWKK